MIKNFGFTEGNKKKNSKKGKKKLRSSSNGVKKAHDTKFAKPQIVIILPKIIYRNTDFASRFKTFSFCSLGLLFNERQGMIMSGDVKKIMTKVTGITFFRMVLPTIAGQTNHIRKVTKIEP